MRNHRQPDRESTKGRGPEGRCNAEAERRTTQSLGEEGRRDSRASAVRSREGVWLAGTASCRHGGRSRRRGGRDDCGRCQAPAESRRGQSPSLPSSATSGDKSRQGRAARCERAPRRRPEATKAARAGATALEAEPPPSRAAGEDRPGRPGPAGGARSGRRRPIDWPRQVGRQRRVSE
jgi:hypothetical protein